MSNNGNNSNEGAKNKVIVIGAGLAGLACAIHLRDRGIPFVVLEAGTTAGGRVATDVVDGFVLDRGFQVLLTSYPEARRMLDFEALGLKAYEPGAVIRKNGKFCKVADPFRQPDKVFQTLRADVGGFKDKLLIGKLKFSAGANDLNDTELRGRSTESELRGFGFSDVFIDSFFRPFFGGIFLERGLQTNAAMFRYLFHLFATGFASVPVFGMGQIAQQLVKRAGEENVRYNARVRQIRDGEVVLDGGEVIAAEQIVLATDWTNAARLLSQSSDAQASREGALRLPIHQADCAEAPSPHLPRIGSRSVTCLYFKAPSLAGRGFEPMLYLNGDGNGLINNLSFPSLVSDRYAPAGAALVSVTVLGTNNGARSESLERSVSKELVSWFGDAAQRWEHIRTYEIAHALPDQSPPFLSKGIAKFSDRLFVCGDYLENGSINGALISGREAADAVMQSQPARTGSAA